MKYIVAILLVLSGYIANAQLPSNTFNSRWFTGNTRTEWIILDSPLVNKVMDTFYARYQGTQIVRIQGGDTALWFYGGNRRWFRGLQAPDTLSLSNRINLKLNTTDTTGKWWGIGKRWVDTVYRVNDSTIGFTINNGALQTFQILGRSVGGGGGGSGTVTSVALSMPSAFSVTGSPITTSGTFNISGAGTAAQYIRGNGTLATTDTGMIPDFHLKVRSLFSGTSPITYNSTTGAIGITDANTSGTKGAATFNNSQFVDDGNGLISLSTSIGGDKWNITGNSGLNESLNFIGTTDSKSFIVRTKNIEAFRVDTFRRVAIGRTTARKIVDIAGDIYINDGYIGRGGGNQVSNYVFSDGGLVSNTTGTVNTAMGWGALNNNTTGFSNTGIGGQAGFTNMTGSTRTTIGYQAAFFSTGSGIVALGAQAGSFLTTESNKLVIHNSNFGAFIYGDMATMQLQIGNSVALPTLTPSAALESISTTRGFLPPRMTAAQRSAISSPATGLEVFDTDSLRKVIYRGGVWKFVAYTDDITLPTTLYTGNGSISTDRTVTAGANTLTVTGSAAFADGAQFDAITSGSVGIAIRGQSTDGRGVMGVATTGVGVYGSATGTAGYGLFANSSGTSGNAIYGSSISGIILEGVLNPTSTNTVIPSIRLTRSSQSPGTNGIGQSIDLYNHTSTTDELSNQIISKWTDATNATRTSQLELYGVNSAISARKAALAGSGQWTWDGYGAGTFTGTSNGTLQVTSGGAVIEGPIVDAGLYTPSLTAVSNTSSPLLDGARFNRVGNVVTFSLRFSVTTTSGSTSSSVRATLPVSSNFSNANQAAGTNSGSLGAIEADAANDEVVVTWVSGSGGSETIVVTGQYTIL